MNLIPRRARAVPEVCYLAVVLVAGCILVSCGSSSKNIQLAQDSVGLFHAQLDREQYSSIYSGTDEKFRGATTELEFTKLLQAVHNKLGTGFTVVYTPLQEDVKARFKYLTDNCTVGQREHHANPTDPDSPDYFAGSTNAWYTTA